MRKFYLFILNLVVLTLFCTKAFAGATLVADGKDIALSTETATAFGELPAGSVFKYDVTQADTKTVTFQIYDVTAGEMLKSIVMKQNENGLTGSVEFALALKYALAKGHAYEAQFKEYNAVNGISIKTPTATANYKFSGEADVAVYSTVKVVSVTPSTSTEINDTETPIVITFSDPIASLSAKAVIGQMMATNVAPGNITPNEEKTVWTVAIEESYFSAGTLQLNFYAIDGDGNRVTDPQDGVGTPEDCYVNYSWATTLGLPTPELEQDGKTYETLSSIKFKYDGIGLNQNNATATWDKIVIMKDSVPMNLGITESMFAVGGNASVGGTELTMTLPTLYKGNYIVQVPARAFVLGHDNDNNDSGECSFTFTCTGEMPVPTELANADFAAGVMGDVNIATYDYDVKEGTNDVAQMQNVPGWNFGVENGNARAAGVVAYGSKTTLGGAAYTVPAAGPEGSNGNALAVVGVWTGTVKYVQDVKLAAGKYTMTVPVYNTSGTKAFVKNLVGVSYGDTTAMATATSYPVGKWVDETVTFELDNDTVVTVSLGYEGANCGSGDAQHLFYDCVKIETYNELAVAKAAAIAALPVGNKSLFTPSAEAVDSAKAAIEAATTIEEVAAAAATEFAIPALEGEYMIYNTTAENYLGTTDTATVVLSADPVAVTFEQAEGGFYIKAGEEYINMAGNNNWSMSANAEAKTAWNFNLADGNYTIQGPKGMIGTDATDAGSLCFGDKNAAKNGVWTISEFVAPAEISVALIPADSTAEEYTINSHTSVSVELPIAAIKVAGLDLIQDTVTYAIYTVGDIVSEGILSVNTIGYAEFEEPVKFYVGGIYTVVVKTADKTLFEAQFNGAAEEEKQVAPEITSMTVNPIDHKSIAIHFDAEDAAPTYNGSFTIELPDGTGINMMVTGEYGQDFGDMIYTFGAMLENGEYVLVLSAGSMTFKKDGTPFGEDMRIPFTVEGIPTAIDAIAADEAADGKYLEAGKVVIVKAGVKYNAAGQIVR